MNTQHSSQPQFADFGDEAPATIDGPVRLSGLALLSIITGGMTIVGCIIPAVGFIPVVFGVLGLFAISKARGRLTGRGLALGGVLMGIFSLVISSGIWIGGTIGLHKTTQTYVNIFDHDPSNVRTILSANLAGSITDEQIATFQEALTREHGDFVAMPKSILQVLLDLPVAQGYDRLKTITPPQNGTILPIPITMTNGVRMVLFILDPTEKLGSGMLAVLDVGFFTADESTIIWLVSPSQSTSAGTASSGPGTAPKKPAGTSGTPPPSENTGHTADENPPANESEPTKKPNPPSSSTDN